MPLDDEQAKPVQERPAGRCLQCHAIVPLEDAFPKLPVNGERTPLIHLREGAHCGPVAKALIYHVVGLIGPNHVVSRQPTLQTPEENYVQVLAMWRAAIEAGIQIRDDKGSIVIGAQRPHLVIIDWKPIGAEL